MDFSFGKAAPQPIYERSENSPRRILILADLSARAARGALELGVGLSERPLVPVDVDNLDEVLFRYAPVLNIGREDGAEPIRISFGAIDDFHPDQLFLRVPLLQELKGLRTRLAHPATFEAAARELRQLYGGEAAPREVVPEPESKEPPAVEEGDDLFERLLGAPQQTTPTPSASGPVPGIDVSALIRDLVQSDDFAPAAGPEQGQYLAMVDDRLSSVLRAILHHPLYQDLERAWRSVEWLAHRCDAREGFQIRVLDLSQEEIAADLASAGGDPKATALARLLSSAGAGSDGGWSLIINDAHFGQSPDDLQILGALASLAASLGGPLLAGAAPEILGIPSILGHEHPSDWAPLSGDLARRWQMLRSSGVASWIGLALPRFILRMPYGRLRDPIDAFSFEEVAPDGGHDEYLWANPAFAIANCLIAAASKDDDGWFGTGGDELVVDDLPAIAVERGGQKELLPGAEAWISDEAALMMLSRGLIPLISRRESNEVRLMGLRSLSDPPKDLSLG